MRGSLARALIQRIAFALLVLGSGAGAILGFLSSLGPAHAQRTLVHYRGATPGSWEEVFAHPQHIGVRTLITGRVIVPKPMLLDGDNPLMKNFVDDGSPMLVFAHLVQHAERGSVLIDSGLDASYAGGSLGHIQAPGKWFYELQGVHFEQQAGQDVHAQLARLGVQLNALYFTHLHGDHASALPSFDRKLPVFVGQGEPDDIGHHIDFGLVDQKRSLREIDFRDSQALWPFAHAVDVYGDGSFWALSTPGHTSGHVSYLINSDQGAVLLTGDACHMRWAFEHDVAPGGSDAQGKAAARDSLERIRKFAARYPQVQLIFGHQFRNDAQLATNR
jgi:N-acyl homoserine lactone hydrolase